jgi:predicted ferric reductase
VSRSPQVSPRPDPVSQAAVGSRPQPVEPSLKTRPRLYYALFAFNAVLILGFWWIGSGTQPVRSTGDLLNVLGRVTGLLGTYGVLWQLVLMARVPWLEAAFGLEKLAMLHRWNGYAAFGLLVAHAIFQTLGYQLLDGLGTVAQIGDFIAAYDGLLGAIVGLLLLAAVVSVSIAISRRRLAYETWYFIHLYTYLGIALAFSHELAVGADFIANRAFVFYWWVLYIAVAGCLLAFRVLNPLLRFDRHRFQVQRVQREAPGVFSIYVRGHDLSDFETKAGQFLLWRFLDRRRWWQSHPFSLSMAPNRRQLRLTVKAIGDFTSGVATLKPGTRVLIEGPFGQFTERHRLGSGALLIAGGIGITPLRALAEEMVAEGVDVCLLYRCRREEDIVFRDELDRLAEHSQLRVEYLLSHGRGRSPAPQLGPELLRRLVPDLLQREIYVCGPPGMRTTVRESLRRLGAREEQIHAEVFRLAP